MKPLNFVFCFMLVFVEASCIENHNTDREEIKVERKSIVGDWGLIEELSPKAKRDEFTLKGFQINVDSTVTVFYFDPELKQVQNAGGTWLWKVNKKIGVEVSTDLLIRSNDEICGSLRVWGSMVKINNGEFFLHCNGLVFQKL